MFCLTLYQLKNPHPPWFCECFCVVTWSQKKNGPSAGMALHPSLHLSALPSLAASHTSALCPREGADSLRLLELSSFSTPRASLSQQPSTESSWPRVPLHSGRAWQFWKYWITGTRKHHSISAAHASLGNECFHLLAGRTPGNLCFESVWAWHLCLRS